MQTTRKIATAGLTALLGLGTMWASAASAEIDGPDQLAPHVKVANAQITEGDAGTKVMNFSVTLSHAVDNDVHVNIKTAVPGGPTSAEASDYAFNMSVLLFQPGIVQRNFAVKIKGDTVDEYNETLLAQVTGTNAFVSDGTGSGFIADDDNPPSVSIGDVSKAEGTGGPTGFHFPVELSAASEKPISVKAAAFDGPAKSPADWTAAGATLSFAPGETEKAYPVSVVGDSDVENNETFGVKLSSPSNVTLVDATGKGTIVNDDVEQPADDGADEPDDEPEQGQGGQGGQGNNGGGNGTPGTTVPHGQPVVEGEQALADTQDAEPLVAAERRAEDGISLSTWLLLLATGLTAIGIAVLVIGRRRQRA